METSARLPLGSSRRRPNILFLLPDQHRADWLGHCPALPLRTPSIDILARRGMRFTRAFCVSPLCAPSRASLASGRTYGRCGVTNNGQDFPLALPTYYRALRDVGYAVGGVGKFDLHKPTLDWGLDGSRLVREWGFTHAIDNEGKLDGSSSYRLSGGLPKGPYLAFLHARGRAESYVREHDAEFRRPRMDAYTTCLSDEEYCDNWVAANALEQLRHFPVDRPWHLVVNFTGPHNPMEVTASMRRRWEHVDLPLPHRNEHPDRQGILRARQNYATMIENIDRNVGSLIEAVRQRRELEHTLVVYSSDHGEMLGDHGRWGKGVWYNPSAGIPLVIAGPGVRRNAVSDVLVSLHDLAATFLEAAGAPGLPGMDAISLWRLLAGETTFHRRHICCGLDGWRFVFDGRFKLVVGGVETPLLYDLEEDPREDTNVAARNPRHLQRLAELMEKPEVAGV